MGDRKRIGLREVRALGPGEIVYDTKVPGFAARRQRDGVSYVLRYRTASGRQRWHTIGRHGAGWTPDMARAEAQRILGEVVRGADPQGDKLAARHAMTITDLCDAYWADVKAGRLLLRGGRPKKASTLVTDASRIEAHIKPLLGRVAVAALTKQDVANFMHAVAEGKSAAHGKTSNPRGWSNVRGGRGTATRTVGLLSGILSYAVEQGLRDDNPAHRLRKFADGRRERRLSDGEYAALGEALREENVWPPAVAAIKFLVLTGWRSGEALGLRWDEIDLARRTAILPDTKTGRSMRPLSHAACDAVRAMPRIDDPDLVFPPARSKATMRAGFRWYFDQIAKLCKLPKDVTPHTLRHSFASVAADLGYSEPTIAALIGHKGQTITSRYVHSADTVLLAAADAVARRISELMGEVPTADVLPLRVAG